MKFVSLCDGIGAAHEAWTPLGWVCVARAEIEAFPLAVTHQRQPGPAELGDVSKITEDQIALLGPVDVVIFGSPCQDLSVAGKRKGLAGARSGLFFDCMRVALWCRDHCGARWIIWENVPGAFSSHKGADFAVVVGAMAGSDDCRAPAHGWGHEGCAVGDNGMVEWAVLDAQWFGLAQRRKRVFAILDLGDWASRPPILLERQGLRGDTPPRRAQGQGVAGPSAEGAGGRSAGQFGPAIGFNGRQDPVHGPVSGALDTDPSTQCIAQAYSIMPQNSGKDYKARPVDVAQPLLAAGPGSSGAQGGGFIAFAIQAGATRENPDSGPDGVGVQADHAYTLEARAEVQAVAFALRGRDDGAQPEVHGPGDAAGALRAASGGSTRDYVAYDVHGVPATRGAPETDVHTPLRARIPGQSEASTTTVLSSGYAVRRLTPTECHRLQGFPATGNRATVGPCLSTDLHRIVALAERRNPKSQSDASNALGLECEPTAKPVVRVSITYRQGCGWPAVELALLNCGDAAAPKSNVEKYQFDARIAERVKWFLQAALTENSAQYVAHMLRDLQSLATRETNAPGSTTQSPGKNYASGFGGATGEHADVVWRFIKDLPLPSTSITSPHGPDTLSLDWSKPTPFYFAALAILGCIPQATLNECSFQIEIGHVSDHCAVTYRGKPAADGPMYKALGNSMAVPVIQWIGRQIEMADMFG